MSAIPRIDERTYLEQERLSETKSEFIDGEVYAMTGASPAHNLVASNLIRELGNLLKRRPCRVYTSDQRVSVEQGYLYPDVSVVCGQPQYFDKDNLINPQLLVEVLSPSTADYDLGGKFARYRSIPSLKEYLLVAQDRPQVIHYLCQDDHHWLMSELEGIGAVLDLPTIQCRLPLAEIYDKVLEAGPD
jgi:Uma2 family endonuclease